MSSEIAQKLADILKESEAKAYDLDTKLEAVKLRTAKVKEREDSVSKREEDLKAEALSLVAYRDVASERIKTQDMVNRHKVNLEKFDEQRSAFAREQAKEEDRIRKLKIDLEGAISRTKGKTEKIEKAEKALKDEKIAHHEKMLRDMQDIEQLKREARK